MSILLQNVLLDFEPGPWFKTGMEPSMKCALEDNKLIFMTEQDCTYNFIREGVIYETSIT